MQEYSACVCKCDGKWKGPTCSDPETGTCSYDCENDQYQCWRIGGIQNKCINGAKGSGDCKFMSGKSNCEPYCTCTHERAPDISFKYKCDDKDDPSTYCDSKPNIGGVDNFDITIALGCTGTRTAKCATRGPNKDYCECQGTGW